MGRRQRFSKEFKLEAVRLLDLGRKSAVELALELGVRRNQLYKWKELLSTKKEAAFRGPGPQAGFRRERGLAPQAGTREDHRRARHLKKAVAYFARDLP